MSACTTAEMLFSTIESKVYKLLKVSLKDKKITFGNKDENITINNETYAIFQSNDGSEYYNVKDLNNENYSYGSFPSILSKVQNYDYTLNPMILQLIPNNITVDFNTNSVVDDPGATTNSETNTSEIGITYYGVFMAE